MVMKVVKCILPSLKKDAKLIKQAIVKEQSIGRNQ
jgi:hypothetical protein